MLEKFEKFDNLGEIAIFLSDRESVEFAKKYVALLGDEFDAKACLSWINESLDKIQKFNKTENGSLLYPNFNSEIKDKKTYFALFLAYILHFNQTRKVDGSDYKVHLIEAIRNRFSFLKKEHEVFHMIMACRTAMNGVFKLLLHDGVEDMFENLGDKVLLYNTDCDSKDCKNSKAEKQKQLYADLIRQLYRVFEDDEDVVNSILYVFTNFSKRILTVNSIKGKLDKEDMGRINFLVRIFSITKIEDLILTLSEKLHNLKTKEVMSDSKMIEYYHLAIALMGAGIRGAGKDLLKEFFPYYLNRNDPEAAQTFQIMLEQKRESDKRTFSTYQSSLEESFDSIYGAGNYEIIYRELDAWKVYEIVLQEMKKEFPDKMQNNAKDDSLSYYFVNDSVIKNPDFQNILQKMPTYRVVVKISDECDGDFHRSKAKFALDGFTFLPETVTDYYNKDGNPNLVRADYKAFCFSMLLNGKNKIVPFKMLLEKDFNRNEYGNFNSKFNEKENKFVKVRSVVNFAHFCNEIKKIIDEKAFNELLEKMTEYPEGVDLDQTMQEFLNLSKNDKYAKFKIKNVLKRISIRVRDFLRLYPWLEVDFMKIVGEK